MSFEKHAEKVAELNERIQAELNVWDTINLVLQEISDSVKQESNPEGK